ncbi:MAG: hypothetical protein WD055_01740 [Candidatus Dependentiae bacterium]
MTRLHSLALVMLLAVSSVAQSVTFLSMPSLPSLPTWANWNTVSGYCTAEACQNGWKNTRDFTTRNAAMLQNAIVQNPYIAAAIAAGSITVGGLAYMLKTKYAARKMRQQEVNDLVYAMMLELELQDAEYARQLQEELNGGVDQDQTTVDERDIVALVNQLLADEQFAAYLQDQEGQLHVEITNEDLAGHLMRDEEDLYRERQAQIAADEQFARELEAQA